MKTIIKVFLAISLLFSVSCNDFEWFSGHKEYAIRIYNNSVVDINVYAAYMFPDTLLPIERPVFVEILKNNKKRGFVYDYYVNDLKFKRLKKGDILTLFILDKNVVDNNVWDSVRINDMILRRFNFDKEKGYDVYYP